MNGPAFIVACAACFGDPSSPLNKGMTWGILFLLTVVGAVLGAIIAFFVYLNRKAHEAALRDPETIGIRRIQTEGHS
ncbi:MAG: hypothetical protein JO317_01570 [Verrucomicrobiae bacterium]|nr:hypothetical protein [Verrucomicrobiae bacterium]